MLLGETYGRRDHAFIYSNTTLEAVVKERFRLRFAVRRYPFPVQSM